MNFIITLLINAGILLGMAYVLPSVKIKSYGTAILVALVIGLLNATLGMLIRFPMNVVTLGLISFIVHLIVTALMIKLADKFFDDFEVKGFTPALIIALVMAIVGTFI
ncbi:phage holin family protein [Pedobacter steynii]|uniref:Phage holin family protein n=1 Tax=Pedobacter steynii TaxID=430522 RepID=A0A1D7QGI3_9SPHI|nr:phage holin family protein [Pedobacter steynii]AOM77771.1 hypothetical protein BFS30_11655 [Pedobacter steynii]